MVAGRSGGGGRETARAVCAAALHCRTSTVLAITRPSGDRTWPDHRHCLPLDKRKLLAPILGAEDAEAVNAGVRRCSGERRPIDLEKFHKILNIILKILAEVEFYNLF